MNSISGTLFTVDLRIMNMSEINVILGMDWLTAYRVVIEDSTHSGHENHGHVRVRCHPRDGLVDSL